MQTYTSSRKTTAEVQNYSKSVILWNLCLNLWNQHFRFFSPPNAWIGVTPQEPWKNAKKKKCNKFLILDFRTIIEIVAHCALCPLCPDKINAIKSHKLLLFLK